MSPLRRRTFLVLAGGLGSMAGSGVFAGRAAASVINGELLTSRIELPEPFSVPLPVAPLAKAVRQADGSDRFEVVQRAADVEILPGVRTRVWGFDGLFPGPVFTGQAGRPVVVSVRNELPVPTSMHLHGGVTPPDSDGYPTDLVVPAGWQHHDAMAGGHHDAPAAGRQLTELTKEYRYPLDQRAATLWYHDHRMDFTAPQVWRGLLGLFVVRDSAELALPLPSGERDLPLLICDRAFDEDGDFRYPSLDPELIDPPGVEDAYMAGVVGDVVLVNGAPWPELEVDAARYRLRLLNGSNARRYRLALRPGPRDGAAFTQIGSDAGLLAEPVELDAVPIAPGERYDVVVDFSAWPVGSTVTLVNTLGDGDTRWVMRFRVVREAADDSEVPARLADPDELSQDQAVAHRQFSFRRTRTSHGGHAWTINGESFDPETTLATTRLGSVERWRFISDVHHPVHLHLAHFQVVARGGGDPHPSDGGWKDTVDVRPKEPVDVLVRFRGYPGRYILHCHNLEHEDMAMMGNFQVE
ncbi:multicopper oxidase family protein [Kitasatospora sp. NPDC048540]|uniref:multicopper oxidase family protein n=1 Tax=Kitasatospora sp. NPDC048540 TaxID=3155634 RepID=UPI0033C0E85A